MLSYYIWKRIMVVMHRLTTTRRQRKLKSLNIWASDRNSKKAGEWLGKARTVYDAGRQAYNAYREAVPAIEGALAEAEGGAMFMRGAAPFAALAAL